MKITAEKRELLDRVFAEADLAELKAALRLRCLAELDRTARRRRVWRTGLGLAAVAAVVLVAFLLEPLTRPAPLPPADPGTPAYLVSSTALGESRQVRTRPAGAILAPERRPDFLVVTTTTTREVPLIGDLELLAHIPDAPCGLVTATAGEAHLVFFDPKDRKRYLADLDDIAASE